MRVGVVIAALLAVGSLVLHLALPFASVEVPAEDVVTAKTLSREAMAQRLDGDPVGAPGASMGYLLAGSIVMAAGGVGLLFGLLPGPAGRWSLFGGASLAGVGAAMSLHGNALWIGRAVSSWIHEGITGATTPAAAHAHLNEFTPGDGFASILPVSPFLVVATSLCVLAVLGRTWAAGLRSDHGIRDMALRHGRMAWLGALVLVLTATMPWVVQELPDDPAADDGPTSFYFWSAYDILEKRAAGQEVAQMFHEARLVPWNGLGVVLQFTFAAGIVAILAPWAGLAGRHLESMGHGVFGRLIENLSLVTVASYAFLVVAGVLGAFFLQDPSRFEEAVTTGSPMLASVVGVAGLILAGLMARRVLAVDGDVVADDFPEPVVYD